MSQPGLAALALPRPCLMLVTDRQLAGGDDALVASIAAALDGGVNAVQLREKDLTSEALLPLARRLRELCTGRAALLVNERLAVALAAAADGVHGGEEALPVSAMRRAAQGRLLVGRSAHSLASTRQAAEDGADYLLLGTIFPSRSHPGGPVAGVALVEQVCSAVSIPVIGIGGITAENAGAVLNAGAAGIAVISAIIGQADPRAAAAKLRGVLDEAAGHVAAVKG